MRNNFWYPLKMVIFQYRTCFPFSYRSSNFAKSDNFRESNREKKKRTDRMKEAKKIKSENFKEAINKSPILLSQYLKIR